MQHLPDVDVMQHPRHSHQRDQLHTAQLLALAFVVRKQARPPEILSAASSQPLPPSLLEDAQCGVAELIELLHVRLAP